MNLFQKPKREERVGSPLEEEDETRDRVEDMNNQASKIGNPG